MNAVSDNTLPPGTFKPENNDSDFVGVFILAVPAAMTAFLFRLLLRIMERELEHAGVCFRMGGTYDRNFGAFMFEVNSWKPAARCLKDALDSFGLSAPSAICRYDF